LIASGTHLFLSVRDFLVNAYEKDVSDRLDSFFSSILLLPSEMRARFRAASASSTSPPSLTFFSETLACLSYCLFFLLQNSFSSFSETGSISSTLLKETESPPWRRVSLHVSRWKAILSPRS